VKLSELICSLSSCCKCAVAALQLKSILGDGPKIKDSIEDPFRKETWLGNFVLGYTLESKVRPLHQGYVSVTTLYLALSSE
jgi:hypothetical protein